jgi:hypothetical protein
VRAEDSQSQTSSSSSSKSSISSRGKSVSFSKKLEVNTIDDTAYATPRLTIKLGVLKSALRASKSAFHGNNQRRIAA